MTNQTAAYVKKTIKTKMRTLADFDICDANDAEMVQRLTEEVEKHPDKDARLVLDYYCRPIIQAKVNSWK